MLYHSSLTKAPQQRTCKELDNTYSSSHLSGDGTDIGIQILMLSRIL